MATKRSDKTHNGEQPHEPESPVEEVAGEVLEALGEARDFSARLARTTIVGVIAYLGEVTVLMMQALRAVRRGVHLGDLARQMAVIGVDSIPIALLTVGFSGAVLALYTVGSLTERGFESLVGGIVALSIVRETGPILTGVALAARAGSAMTAEIASMKVTEQIDALRSMAISPIDYLVTPRLLAALIMLPMVTVFADVIGILGGAMVSSSLGVPTQVYVNSMRQWLDPNGSDVFKGLLKTVVFGATIAAVGCREGLRTEGGATGVGHSTTRSVVVAIILIFVADFVLSFMLFGSGLI